MPTANLILDTASSGVGNMGRDEALLHKASHPESIVTLRFYAWDPATISLGYFQSYDEIKTLDSPAADLPVVRRTTGGGAILHDQEITYSLTLPATHPLVIDDPNRLYRLAHAAVIRAVGHGLRLFGDAHCGSCGESSRRGPFFCFARRHPLDVVVDRPGAARGTAKLAGSAQRRTPLAILQHGSIMLGCRYPQQPVATWSELEGRPISFAEAAERLTCSFAEVMECEFHQIDWPPALLEIADEARRRYESAAWTVERRRESGPISDAARLPSAKA